MGATLNSSVDPCESKTLVISDSKPGLDQNKVVCNCHPNSSTCHITILYSFLLSLRFLFCVWLPRKCERNIQVCWLFLFFGSFLIFLFFGLIYCIIESSECTVFLERFHRNWLIFLISRNCESLCKHLSLLFICVYTEFQSVIYKTIWIHAVTLLETTLKARFQKNGLQWSFCVLCKLVGLIQLDKLEFQFPLWCIFSWTWPPEIFMQFTCSESHNRGNP